MLGLQGSGYSHSLCSWSLAPVLWESCCGWYFQFVASENGSHPRLCPVVESVTLRHWELLQYQPQGSWTCVTFKVKFEKLLRLRWYRNGMCVRYYKANLVLACWWVRSSKTRPMNECGWLRVLAGQILQKASAVGSNSLCVCSAGSWFPENLRCVSCGRPLWKPNVVPFAPHQLRGSYFSYSLCRHLSSGKRYNPLFSFCIWTEDSTQ